MKTLAQLRADIQLEMQLDPGLISPAERLRFINAAIEDLSAIGLWQKDHTIQNVVGASVTLPTDFQTPIDFFWGERRLIPAERFAPPGAITGEPITYVLSGRRLDLHPAPITPGTLWVEYIYMGVPLVTDTDVPNFHVDVSELLVNHAVALAHRKNGNVTMFMQYMSYYDSKKFQLIDRLTKEVNSRIRIEYDNRRHTPTLLDRLL